MSSDDYLDDYTTWPGEIDEIDEFHGLGALYMYDKCPKCGGKLVKRNGKYGKFYGCENFSSGCKFTCKADYVAPAVLCEKPKEKNMENMETKAATPATPTPASGMTLDSRLKFLELAKDFTIEKPDFAGADWNYKVTMKNGDLVAFFGEDGLTYHVSGVYNNCTDYKEINPEEFDRLRAFCETLKGNQ